MLRDRLKNLIYLTRSVKRATCALFLLFLLPIPAFSQEFTVTPLGDFGNVTVMEVTGDYDAENPDGSSNWRGQVAFCPKLER